MLQTSMRNCNVQINHKIMRPLSFQISSHINHHSKTVRVRWDADQFKRAIKEWFRNNLPKKNIYENANGKKQKKEEGDSGFFCFTLLLAVTDTSSPLEFVTIIERRRKTRKRREKRGVIISFFKTFIKSRSSWREKCFSKIPLFSFIFESDFYT